MKPVLASLALLAMFASPALGQPMHRLITQAIDEDALVALPGNIRPEAAVANDRGPAADATVLDHMQMLLQRDSAGDAAAAAYVAAQHDPASPLYQQWLTPEAYGARFGLATADIERVTNWLTGHGFTVNAVYPNRMVIDFSGTAGQVARAFHTELHRLVVGGAAHLANVGDPEIPAALSPAVAGLVSLHDFRPQPRYKLRPRYSDSSGDRQVTPQDLAKIYNFNPAFAAGYTGIGQVVAVVENTNLFSNADWTKFRGTFGLSGYASGALVVAHPAASGHSPCGNPGVNDDDVEATLDAEYASAAAPSAQILLASCADTAVTDGVSLAIQNLVNAAAPPSIISVSYGVCETMNGAAANKAFATMYQQAAAEGISVFVATGDNGPSDCAGSQDGANLGIGANGWASTPYNVAVGGTDFGDTYAGTTNTYWSATNGPHWGSAKSYVPEIPWNGNCASALLAKYSGSAVTYGSTGFCNIAAGANYRQLDGGEGAPSGCATGTPAKAGVVGGTCKGTPKPSWQAGIVGARADGVRDTPDVSLFAAYTTWNHAYLFCFSDTGRGGAACQGDPGGWTIGAGTSFATPIWAGIQALVNQKAGKKQGNPAAEYYALANAQYGATGNPSCNSSLGNKTGADCIFHDVTLGDDDSNCVAGTPNCYDPSGTFGVLSTSTTAYQPAFKAHVGYDLPTGLGTVNVDNLVKAWPAPGFSGYSQVTFLLDNSESMLVASTPAGISTLEALLGPASQSGSVVLDPTSAGLKGRTCAFACHWDGPGKDYYGLARGAGVELKFDVVQQAVQAAIGQLFAAEQKSGVARQFGAAIDTFNTGLVQLYPTAGAAVGWDLGPYPANSAGAAAAAAKYSTPVGPDAADTNFPAAMTALVAAATPAGDGASVAAARKSVIIVTDGIQDWGARTLVPGYKQIAGNGKSGGAEGPINAADCAAIKALGYTVYVLYTTYLTQDAEANQAPLLDGNTFLVPYVNGTGANASYDLAANLQACASSPSTYAQAADPAAIAAAMNAMVQSIIGGAAVAAR